MKSRFYLSMLLISGLLLMGILLVAFYGELTPEWKQYQVEFRDSLIRNAKDESAKKRARKVEIGLQQVYLDSLKRADRCTSCHRGVENPLMEDVEVPYRLHSGDYLKNHPVDKFGCTVCHNGQGRATNKREAHGEGHGTHWDFPLLPSRYMQSSCARCHDYEMLKEEGGEMAYSGEQLFREKGCKGCHKLNKVGGDLGKALDGVGSKPIAYFPMKHVVGDRTTYNWIKQHFDDPRKLVPESEMRAFLTEEEAELLTTHILTLRAEDMPSKYMLLKNLRRLKADGESLYKMYCIACHADGKYSVYDEVLKRTIPAIKAPSFIKAIDDRYLGKMIKEGRQGTQMTAWKTDAAGLTEDEIGVLIGYLTGKRSEERPQPFGYVKYTPDLKRGKELYGIRCVMCHGKDGKGGKGLLGVNLTSPVVQGADPEFLSITVRDGRKGTPMVPFGSEGLKLSDGMIADIVAYLKNFSEKKR